MRSIPLFIAAFALFLPFSAACAAQSPQNTSTTQALTNKDVTQMLSVGLSPDIVVAKIKTSACSFDTSPAALKALKSASTPDSVILAMVQAGGSLSKPASVSDGELRIYVSDSQSWLMTGGFGGNNGTGGGGMQGGSSPQTVEVIKTFQQRCPEVVITDIKAKAAYAVLFDRESYKGLLRNRDKIAVFRHNGDSIYSNSTKSVGNAVKDACQVILKDAGVSTARSGLASR